MPLQRMCSTLVWAGPDGSFCENICNSRFVLITKISMPKSSKRRRLAKEASTRAERLKHVLANRDKKEERWRSILEEWEEKCESIYNQKGVVRTYEETCLMLLSLKSKIKSMVEDDQFDDLSWSMLEKTVARELKVDDKHVTLARKTFEEEGTVISFICHGLPISPNVITFLQVLQYPMMLFCQARPVT